MASWLPFALLPIYFAALVGAIVWLAPNTPDAPLPGKPGAEDAVAETPAPNQAERAAKPQRSAQSSPSTNAQRQRSTLIGVILFASYWIGVLVVAWAQGRHGRV